MNKKLTLTLWIFENVQKCDCFFPKIDLVSNFWLVFRKWKRIINSQSIKRRNLFMVMQSVELKIYLEVRGIYKTWYVCIGFPYFTLVLPKEIHMQFFLTRIPACPFIFILILFLIYFLHYSAIIWLICAIFFVFKVTSLQKIYCVYNHR